ncbi:MULTISPECIES: integrase core domain-containing protein, partial [Mycolicibacterium]
QTNGKVERFNRTLTTEWAYAQTYRSEAERAGTYQHWLHHYNHCESSGGWSGTGWQG